MNARERTYAGQRAMTERVDPAYGEEFFVGNGELLFP